MIYGFDSIVEILKFAKKIVGLDKNVILDSGVFEHNIFDDDNILDKSRDIIEIFGNEDKPIELDDVIDAFKEMNKQFKYMERKNLDGRSYCFEGIHHKKGNKYEIHWGS
jgi:hypothetical protein